MTSGESGYWNEVAGDWRTGRDRLWRAHADAVNVALCRRWLPATGGGRILKTDAFDEAVGTGLWPVLATSAARVHVMDHALAIALDAHARYQGMPVTVNDARALPFAAGSFDCVVSNSTLDHFADAGDIARSLGEFHRVLVPGGRLLLTLDNAAHPLVAVRNALPNSWLTRVGLVPYVVGATVGPSGAADLVARVGFRVLDVTAILHCPRVLAVPFARLVNRLSPSGHASSAFLRMLGAFEGAERWPTRFRTGHFVAVLGEKP